ncbi:hypothetical protein VNI00_011621 [Paramarasmius palmivorus]|uniref:BZIP domain-containing protein n=1 Tax=Paramarasmius palmivorus TaxID=297713 RepID=A0AAW0CBZ4_9AGAR
MDCPPTTPPPLQIPMSQIIAADAPLLQSPGSEWDNSLHDTSYVYSQYSHFHHFPPSPPISVAGSIPTDSPIQPNRMLKMRMSPDSSSNCLPTHQLFDLGEVNHFQAPPSPAPSEVVQVPQPQHHHTQQQQEHHHQQQQQQQPRVSISIKPPSIATAMKRSASPAAHLPATTKKRAVGERISTKDFIPPDVSGLSKREARLVKNRAAAFLSRQRKREEFECMEARVQELEQENARLLALTQHGISHSLPSAKSDPELRSEVENLRAQLAAAREREHQLAAELSAKASSTPQESPVKVESVEPSFSSAQSSPRFPSSTTPNKSSAASLGLMVLLCALPTLLSMPTQSALPATFSLPASAPVPSSPSLEFNPYFSNDWSQAGNPLVEFESDIHKDSPHSHKLEFSTDDSKLNGLDISFDTVPAEDGKIRVRIHSSSSTSSSSAAASGSSRATSPGSSSSSVYSNPDNHNHTPPSSAGLGGLGGLDNWDMGSGSGSPYESAQDPFLGIGAPQNDYSFSSHHHHHHHHPSALFSGVGGGDIDSYSQMSGSDYGFDYSPSSSHESGSGRRRVRIALKTMPGSPSEGGEWEVQEQTGNGEDERIMGEADSESGKVFTVASGDWQMDGMAEQNRTEQNKIDTYHTSNHSC